MELETCRTNERSAREKVEELQVANGQMAANYHILRVRTLLYLIYDLWCSIFRPYSSGPNQHHTKYTGMMRRDEISLLGVIL